LIPPIFPTIHCGPTVASMPQFSCPYASIKDAELCSEQFAKKEDEKDELSKLRNEFLIPSKGDLKNKKYGFQQKNATHTRDGTAPLQDSDSAESMYLCGNSLGLQPRRTREYVNRYLDTWASKGVFGHFTDYEGGLPPWLHIDDAVKERTAKIVGALPSEVAIMETLTANLHLLMSSFYRPTKDRWKIIIEGKAFPSDHVSFVILSHKPTMINTRFSMQRCLKSPTTISILQHSLQSNHPHPQLHISPTNTFSPSSRNTPPQLLLYSIRANSSTLS
jgi:kynureninase